MITITVNNKPLDVQENTRLIDAIRDAGTALPGICYKKETTGEKGGTPGTCRICRVTIDGTLASACERTVKPGMNIQTNSPQVLRARQFALCTIAQEHPGRCLDCPASPDCTLLEMVGQLNVLEPAAYAIPQGSHQRRGDMLFDLQETLSQQVTWLETPSLEFDSSLCINCGRCADACPTGAIGVIGRGINRRMGPPPGINFEDICINCGQCTKVCPTGALVERSSIAPVEAALSDPAKRIVFQIAPAVRVALGEEFGLPAGEIITGRVYAALRDLGVAPEKPSFIKEFNVQGELVDKNLRTNVLVTDTNVTADLTIMEEGTELISRIQKGGKLPIITSCCPAWIKYMETFYPQLSQNVSSVRSPQQIMGSLSKTYGAKVWNIDPQDIVTVSVMPCTAKKFESQRYEMNSSSFRDVDYVLTTRELAKMLKTHGIDLAKLKDEKADYPFEEYTGAGTLFGNTGGVMEAALRTVHKVITGNELEGIEFGPARGMESVKEATVKLNDSEVKIAVMHGLNGGHIQEYLDRIVAGTQDNQLAAVEIMACPGGCIGGGGQPKEFDWTTKVNRTSGLNKDDQIQRFRRSHESPVVQRIYAEYLDEPNSHNAHELCHTEYVDRSKNLTSVPEVVR